MYDLIYVRPTSLEQAISLLSVNEEAKVLAGGMTLVPTLKQHLAMPSHLIDISALPELRGIGVADDVLSVGAAMRHAEVSNSKIVNESIPALAFLAGEIADPQVRNRGTMGGSVANNDPAADYPSAVLGLGATVVTSHRRIASDDFFMGMFETALEPGELIVRFEYPIPKRAAYAKHRHPASGFAVVGVFVAEALDGYRVAVTGAGTSVFRWNAAEHALNENDNASALDHLIIAAEDVSGDVHTSAAHKAHLVGVYTRRAVESLAMNPY